MRFPFILAKRFLGIDVGTSAIKVVELSKWAGRIKLENYGQISAPALHQETLRTFEKNTLFLSTEDISRAIKAIIEEAKIKSRQCAFSIPDFSTFFTTFEMPPMTSAELPQAVRVEARRHVPIPLGEVTLDWQLIEGIASDHKGTKLKILLVAVPNEVVNQYRKIAEILNLEVISLEAEVFGLIRSLIGKEEKRLIGLVDIGHRTTTCSIIEKGVLKTSRSFDPSGDDLTERIAKELGIDCQLAQGLKEKYGILPSQLGLEGRNIREILTPLVDLIVKEIKKTFQDFYLKEKKEIAKIILAGGSALLPGILEYFQDYFKKEVEIANPFSKIFSPPKLEKTLKEMGPSYAIALGMALRGFEE